MGTTVQLFVTCLVDTFYPEVGEATVDLLERAGCAVEFPFDQTCCGQPAFNGGFTDEARSMAIHTVEVLDATEGPIVIPSGSCGQMIAHHIPDLLAGTPHHAAAIRVAARIHELTSFLVDELGVTSVPGASTSATYHASCHGLRGLGLRTQPIDLIEASPGVERIPLPDEDQCCGFGGLFSVELPEVSAALLDEKLDAIESTGAEYVVATDVGCLMHIGGGLRRRSIETRPCHIAELLAGRLP
jgi:L-lactate dehydrogenase complex protein LldE